MTDKWVFVNRDDKRVLKMQCPQCKQWQDLEDHSIDEAGQVLPSVVCGDDCGFHDFIQLAGFPNKP